MSAHEDPTPPDVRIDEHAPPPRLPKKGGTPPVMRRATPRATARPPS